MTKKKIEEKITECRELHEAILKCLNKQQVTYDVGITVLASIISKTSKDLGMSFESFKEMMVDLIVDMSDLWEDSKKD